MYHCMTQNIRLSRNLQLKARTVRWEFITALLIIILLAIFSRKSFGANVLSQNSEDRVQIIFTDSQSAVLRADTAIGGPAIVAVGEKLIQPFGICMGETGELFVSDTGCLGIIGIDPQTGAQRVVAHNSMLGVPFGIAAERGGAILVANGQALIRLNPETGALSTVASGNYLRVPLAVAVADNGNIFVADALGAIVQVNPRNGQQTPITSAGYLHRPQGLAVRGNDIYVTDVATADGNFGIGRIVHIDARSGEQTVLSEGRGLVGPVGIAIEQNGNLIVGDPYTINEQSAEKFDGAIIRVDATSGAQELLARGQDNFVNPRCVALVRTAGE